MLNFYIYKNSFYNKDNKLSKEFIETNVRPKEYKGYLIYHRINSGSKWGDVFDVVKDDVCIKMCTGIGYARQFIDSLIVGVTNEKNFTKFLKKHFIIMNYFD